MARIVFVQGDRRFLEMIARLLRSDEHTGEAFGSVREAFEELHDFTEVDLFIVSWRATAQYRRTFPEDDSGYIGVLNRRGFMGRILVTSGVRREREGADMFLQMVAGTFQEDLSKAARYLLSQEQGAALGFT